MKPNCISYEWPEGYRKHTDERTDGGNWGNMEIANAL